MKRHILKDFQTFSEFPDKYLKITSKSEYYFVQKDEESFITRKNLDSFCMIDNNDISKIKKVESYYDINYGDLIFKDESILDINTGVEIFKYRQDNNKVISLSSILNLKENDVYYFDKEDISSLINHNNKVYKLK